MFLCGEAELLVFDLARVAEASVLVLLLWPPSLCMLEVDREALARRSGELKFSYSILLMLQRLWHNLSIHWRC